MKKMFVVMEVEDFPSDPNWVKPIGSGVGEAFKKSRVIYADEMIECNTAPVDEV